MNEFLIERLQNFTLDRKILSVDTNDRDINRWKNPNEFEVSCPQTYTNVESIRLVNIQYPTNLNNISEHLQNNKMMLDVGGNKFIIELDDGYYTNSQVCSAIQRQVNKNFATVGNDFFVHYNEVSEKPHFMSLNFDFSLIFQNVDISYATSSISSCINNVLKQHSDWGLGSILGFDSKLPISSHGQTDSNSSELYFYHDNTQKLPSATGVIIPNNKINLNYNQFIYLEIDKFNSADEIEPYKTDSINNTNSGRVKSYFAKIPIKKSIHNEGFCGKDDFLDNMSYYQPAIDKISKLKIKFRYHNGELIDLGNKSICFSLEINQIRNELKDYKVRTPFRV